MARGLIADFAVFRDPLDNNSLFLGEYPEITVYEAGTDTPVDPDTIYDVPEGGEPLGTNPVIGGVDGQFRFWIDTPRLVKLKINVPIIGSYTVDDVPTWVDPTSLLTLDGFQTVSNLTLEDWRDKGGIVYDVGAFKYNEATLQYDEDGLDPYDLASGIDATPALLLAGAAAHANGGGYVACLRTIRITTRLIWPFRNVKIIGVQGSQISYNPKVGIINDVPYFPAIVFRDNADEIGNDSEYLGSGGETGMIDISIFQNSTPSADPDGYEGASDIHALVLLYKCAPADDGNGGYVYNGRVKFQNVHFNAGSDNVQIGINAVKGAGEVIFDRCKFVHSRNAIRVQGLDYLFVDQCIGGQISRASGFAFLRLDGSCVNQPDGFYIRSVFTEDTWAGLIINHQAGSIGNCEVVSCVFDGCHIGVWIRAAGTVNGLRFIATLFTGWAVGNATGGIISGGSDDNTTTHESGDHVIHPANSWGALFSLNESTGSVGGVVFSRCRFANFTNQGILVAPAQTSSQMTTLDVEDCTFSANNQALSSTSAVISICEGNTGSGSSWGIKNFSIRRNKVYSVGIFADAHGTGTKPGYAVAIGPNCDNFIVDENVGRPDDVQQAVVFKGTPGNLTTKIYRNNYGRKASTDSPFSMAMNIGGWYLTNIPANQTSGIQLNRSTGGTRGWIAPYNMLFTSMTVESSDVVAGAAITFKLVINGTPSDDIVSSMAVGQSKAVGTSVSGSGVSISQGQTLEILAYTPSGYTSTNNDYSVDVQGVTQE